MRVLTNNENESPPRPRRRRLKYIAVLPTLMTMGNLVCGFAAIHFAMRAMFAAGAGIDASIDQTLDSRLVERMLPSFLSIGAMLIFVGMIFDMLDGLAARVTHRVTEFGAQVDSLADVVTFGVAPAILAVALMMSQWRFEQVMVTPLSEHALGRAMWVCAAAYCICAAIRLARFNVEHEQAEQPYRRFRGLPSPGAAAVVASLILMHEHSGARTGEGYALLYCLPIELLACAFLMISRIRYERITQAYLARRRPYEHLIAFIIVFIVFWSYKAPTIAVLCGLYAASGPVVALIRLFRGGGDKPAPAAAPAGDAESRRQSG